MQRVMIVGGPGSGKSTLAIRLGEKTGLPVYHMDQIHWMSGWVPRDIPEKDALTQSVHAKPAWIFEGGHSRTYAARAARADMLIWLDIPVYPRFWRVIMRLIRGYGRTRPDLPPGCPERLRRDTVEFYRYIWRTRQTSRATIERLVAKAPPNLTVIQLRSLSEINAFLDGL